MAKILNHDGLIQKNTINIEIHLHSSLEEISLIVIS